MQIDDISKLPERYQRQIINKIAERERERETTSHAPPKEKKSKYHNVKLT